MTDWDSLRYILAVAREGGLSGAARVLGVNHATVSRQLAKAEDVAGVRFFTRLASGLQPTEAGLVAIAHAEEVEARMVALDMALASRDENEEGELKVTLPPLLANDNFAEDLKEFKKLHPGIEISILGATEVLNLHRREADVAIRVTRTPEESLWGRLMSSQRAGWFATPEFVEEFAAVLDGADSDRMLPYIAFDQGPQVCPSTQFADLPACRAAIHTDDMVSALSMARQGIGMVRCSHFLGSADRDLMRVPGISLTDHMPIWVLTHPDLRHVPRVTEFMRFIAGRFSARRELYVGPDSASTGISLRNASTRYEGTSAGDTISRGVSEPAQ